MSRSMNLEQICQQIRMDIIECGYKSGRGHISSALSLVEILVALYFMNDIDIDKIKNELPDRDRVILSKGHGGLALYTTLIKAGVLEDEILDGFATIKGRLSTHPVYNSVKGIEMSAGSLGQGLGFASGVALYEKMESIGYRTYVIVGDGELQEGTNWESMLFASQMKLDNLTLIVDRNQLQISGKVDDIVSLNPLKEKLENFGFYTTEVNGHDLNDISKALNEKIIGRPKAIIANTIKGKGVSFIENEGGWHGKGLTHEQYQIIRKEMGE